jgi:uncharacterized caspase-like protein
MEDAWERMRAIAIILAVIVGAIALGGAPHSAAAQKRVALVIGNSAYKYAPKLDNPRNDATDMSAALKRLGFAVVEGYDLDKGAFDGKVRDFATALQGATVGVLFYAGHGLQVGGQNYLVPVDTKAETAALLDFQMVRLDLLQRTMEREAQTNIVFLDACRDNPLARNLARTMGTRSAEVGRGLAAAESGVGTLISFSTQPGNVALDGTGRNSPYASALVRHVSGSTDDLSAILIAVRNDVMKETQGKQVPWEHSALTGRFYFKAAPPVAGPAATAPQPPSRSEEAERAWASAKDTTSIAVLEAFIAHYKDSFYADLARARIEELKKPKVATVPPTRSQPSAEVPPQVTAAIPSHDRYGAIAYSPSTAAQGWAYDLSSQAEAESVALAKCREHATDCIVPIWFRNACGALAVGSSGYGAGWGNDQKTAEGTALQTCSKYSGNCGIRRWVCTTR